MGALLQVQVLYNVYAWLISAERFALQCFHLLYEVMHCIVYALHSRPPAWSNHSAICHILAVPYIPLLALKGFDLLWYHTTMSIWCRPHCTAVCNVALCVPLLILPIQSVLRIATYAIVRNKRSGDMKSQAVPVGEAHMMTLE